uniref:Uncharacterized protein n=1 Tax=Timema douglasi TaxID=61478 RepID=A0A7R8ZH34_TIMDO|nr:unnamed protein product [Timema douglasi]
MLRGTVRIKVFLPKWIQRRPMPADNQEFPR